MPDSNNNAPNTPSDADGAESRMRKALGLQGGTPTLPAQQRPEQARQRHRFAQDGSVPVVMLNSRGDAESTALRDRNAALDTALDSEKAAHAATRRQLQEAQAAVQALQTRLVHADLAHADALASERKAREQAEAVLIPVQPEPELQPEPAAPRPRKVRATTALVREPKPVKWWTPGYRAKTRKGGPSA